MGSGGGEATSKLTMRAEAQEVIVIKDDGSEVNDMPRNGDAASSDSQENDQVESEAAGDGS